MHADPSAIVVALRAVLGPTAEVSLNKVGDEPYAVVKVPAEDECWVNLAVSSGAFPGRTAEAVARAIAELEGWT